MYSVEHWVVKWVHWWAEQKAEHWVVKWADLTEYQWVVMMVAQTVELWG